MRRAPITTVRNRMARMLREIADAPHERRLGISTAAISWQFVDADLQNLPCDPVPYRTLAAIGRHMTAHGVAAPRFVDLGCGLGRPRYFFASRFDDLRGYELIAPIQAAAADQLARVRTRRPGFDRILLTCADATTAVSFDQPLVLFMYNPFGPKPMARLCERLREARCEVYIYYVNPMLEGLITEAVGPRADTFRSNFPVSYFHLRATAS